MAEIKEEKDILGGLGIGTIFLLFVLALFIIWILTGGPNGEKEEKIIEDQSWPPTTEINTFGSSN